MTFKVTQTTNNTKLVGTNDVAVINAIASSMFSKLDFFINQELVSSCSNYHIVSYLKTLLSYPLDYKQNELQESGFFFDESPNTIAESNSSYKKRKELIKESKLVEATSRVLDDIWLSDKLLLPNFDIKLRLERASSDLCLISPVETLKYKLSLEQCILFLKRNKIEEKIYHMHDNAGVIYPYSKTVLRTFNVASGVTNATIENIFSSGTLPERLFVALTSTDAYNGKLNKYVYNFSRFDLTQIEIQVDNVASDNVLKISNTENLQAFHLLVDSLGLGFRTIGLNKSNYINGNVIFGYRLFGNDSNNIRNGKLSILLNFQGGCSENVTVLILGQSQAAMKLASSGISFHNTLT